MLHTRSGDLFWIEAEDFAGSNFAQLAGPDGKPVAVMNAALASAGRMVVAFQRPGDFLEYTFREERDGFWEYACWVRYATPCPSTRLTVTLNGAEVAAPMLPESGDFFARFRWEKLAVLHVPKGNHLLRLTLHTGVIHPDVLVLSPDDGPVTSGACEQRVTTGATVEVKSGDENITRERLWLPHDRNGVPLGGLGTGKIELCQDGGFANLSLNNNQDAPVSSIPGSFLVYREARSGQPAVIRMLEKTGRDWPEIESLKYNGHYPLLEVAYADHALQTRLHLLAFAAMTPGNPEDSAIPGAVFTFTLENPGPGSISGALGFSWENVIGCGGLGMKPEFGPGTARRVDGECFYVWNQRSGNDQEQLTLAAGQGLRFYSRQTGAYDSSQGEYVLAGMVEGAGRIRVTRSYDVEADLPGLKKSMARGIPSARLDTPGEEAGAHPAGMVWAEVLLPPKSKQKVTFVLAWHFPIFRDRFGRDWGVSYTNRFADAAAVADYLFANRERLLAATREPGDRILASSLPTWLKDKIVNDQFPLTTCTWFERSGRFSVNESPSKMSGCLGTIDQRTASQGIYTALYPALDRRELELFGEFQHENGMIPHDLGHGCIDQTKANYIRWPDLVCSFILEVHRYVHATGDLEFGRRMTARIPPAIAWVLTLDDDGDGIPDMGPGRGNTYDNSDWPGCSSFIGSLWIAALEAAADLMRLCGDPAFAATCREHAAKAVRTMNERLWNGAFYRNFVCADSKRTDGEHCLLPQVAGEWCLDLMDLPRGLPEDRVLSALREVFRLNIAGRGFKGPADEVMLNGDPAWIGTAFLQYAWVYFGALAACRDLTKEAECCWHQAYDQQWKINRQPWKTRLCGFALNGRFNGLPWYMTNTASWYILQAVSGFAWSLPDRWLRIEPHLPASWRKTGNLAEDRLSLPLFGAGFRFWLDYHAAADRIAFTLKPEQVPEVGGPEFTVLKTRIPRGKKAVRIVVNGQAQTPLDWQPETGRLRLAIAGAYPAVGRVLTVEIEVI